MQSQSFVNNCWTLTSDTVDAKKMSVCRPILCTIYFAFCSSSQWCPVALMNSWTVRPHMHIDSLSEDASKQFDDYSKIEMMCVARDRREWDWRRAHNTHTHNCAKRSKRDEKSEEMPTTDTFIHPCTEWATIATCRHGHSQHAIHWHCLRFCCGANMRARPCRLRATVSDEAEGENEIATASLACHLVGVRSEIYLKSYLSRSLSFSKLFL